MTTGIDQRRVLGPMRLPHHWTRDFPLLGAILVSLLFMGLQLRSALERELGPGSGGWRRIDRAALEQRIETGDLRDVRADWYHPTRPDEQPAGPGETTP